MDLNKVAFVERIFFNYRSVKRMKSSKEALYPTL